MFRNEKHATTGPLARLRPQGEACAFLFDRRPRFIDALPVFGPTTILRVFGQRREGRFGLDYVRIRVSIIPTRRDFLRSSFCQAVTSGRVAHHQTIGLQLFQMRHHRPLSHRVCFG